MNVSTNVAQKFLRILDKHFPINHEYHKLFNRNNVKVSYSCMSNMETIIKMHNAKVLKDNTASNLPTCNCQRRNECPLEGKCIVNSVVYKATVKTNYHPDMHYIGLTEGSFKRRFSNHKKSFKNENYKHETALSTYIWKLKSKGITNYDVSWSILHHAYPYKCGTRRCDLCTTEKVAIALDQNSLLNKRSEIISTCPHKRKFKYNMLKD